MNTSMSQNTLSPPHGMAKEILETNKNPYIDLQGGDNIVKV